MNLIAYQFKERAVRSITKDGEPWFVAKDVCRILGIKNNRDAVSALDEDERTDVGFTDAIGRNQKTVIISESGLYELIGRSNKPMAKEFRRWVRKEVLPAIRKTGSYAAPAKRFPTSTEMAMMIIARDKQVAVGADMMRIIQPDWSKYGEPGRSGEPRVTIRSAYFASGKGRMAHAATLLTLHGQLDLQLNNE
jgi:prophage antirepressor-like protein